VESVSFSITAASSFYGMGAGPVKIAYGQGSGSRVAVGLVLMAEHTAAVFTALLDFSRGLWSAFMQEAKAPVLIHHVFPGDGDA